MSSNKSTFAASSTPIDIWDRESALPGWKTDRGRMYIILGQPNDRQGFPNMMAMYPAEVWFYYANREKALPAFYLLFFQHGASGAYRLYNHYIDGPGRLFPGQSFTEDDRLEAYSRLQDISPDLAHASITFRADRGSHPSTNNPDAAMDSDLLLADIYKSPHRRVDTSYVNAARTARGTVETEYMFNYLPNSGIVNVLPGPPGASLIHFSVEIEPQHLTLVQDEARFYASFELRGEVTSTASGEIVFDFSRTEFLELSEAQIRQVGRIPFAYRSMFPLISGNFDFRFVLKNRAQSEYTIFQAPIEVPERAAGRALLGEPVLIYNTEQLAPAADSSTYRTYEIGSLRLHPNAKRVYIIGEKVQFYVPLEGATSEQELSFRVTKAEEPSSPLAAKTVRLALYDGKPVVESLDLEKAVGGRYRLQVELADPSGKLETATAHFDITPRNTVARPWVMYGANAFSQAAVVKSTLAAQHQNEGRTSRAKLLYQQALQEDAGLSAARVALARIALGEGDGVRAIEILLPLQEEAVESFDVAVTLADAYLHGGNFSRAAALFEAAMLLQRPEPALLNALATCHVGLGNKAKAISYLQQSLELDPDQEAPRELMSRLQGEAPPERRHPGDAA